MAQPGNDDEQNTWARLSSLLAPVHDEAVLFARRIARSDAEGDDLFQEAVLRAHAKLPALRDSSRFRPWLFQIVISQQRSRWRRRFWRRMVALDDGDEAPEPSRAPEVEARAGAARARRALAMLPPPQCEAVVLFELHGYSIEEIAELCDASVAAIKSRLSRGRARLREIYTPDAEEESHAYSRANT